MCLTSLKVRYIKLKLAAHKTGIRKWRETMANIPLRQMQVNQTGTIAGVKARGDLGRRIRDMGLVPGKQIRIQGRAPLYDPVSLRIMGFTLTLRNNEADHIMVEVN
jgi:ferrous iron transport protein A